MLRTKNIKAGNDSVNKTSKNKDNNNENHEKKKQKKT